MSYTAAERITQMDYTDQIIELVEMVQRGEITNSDMQGMAQAIVMNIQRGT